MRSYPKRRSGSEYYPARSKTGFVVNESGKEMYAVDRKGCQLYPNRDRQIFARDCSGDFYYAKDAQGNEYYPVRSNQSLFLIDSVNSRIRLALYADGTQRYPQDARGNEYYFKDREHPFLMKKHSGESYLARSKNGHELIPWNHIQDYISNEPCVYSRDSNGNTVYLKESEIPQAFKALIRCLCHISVICPNVTGCHTRCY